MSNLVPVDNAFFDKSNKSIHNLFNDVYSSLFINDWIVFNVFLKIALANLLNDVIVVCAFHNFMNFDYIL